MRNKKAFVVVGVAALFVSLFSWTYAGQSTVNSLNALIASNPETLDYLIQDVCVDALDRPIAGDPAVCGTHRNVRIGEKVPYMITDYHTDWNQRFQGLFSYPVPGTDGTLKVIATKVMTDAQRPVLDAGFQMSYSVTRDGFDLIDTSGSHVSSIRTSDGGCLDQKISQDSSNRRNGWILFPTSGVGTGGLLNHNILLNRINISPAPTSTCALTQYTSNNETQDIWNPPVATTFRSGKTLNAVQTYHVGDWNLTLTENSIEKFYFTKEYGFSRWEGWIPLAKCEQQHGAGSKYCTPSHPEYPLKGRCEISSALATWGNQTWVRTDCRDTTYYVGLTTPQIPLTSVMAQNNGLVDIDSASVFAAYEKVLAGNQDFQHVVGTASGTGWQASAGVSGYLTYGPYITSLPAQSLTAYFKLVSDTVGGGTNVFYIDIYDATSGQILGTRLVTRADFAAANVEQTIPMNFSMAGRAGHQVEFRVWTYGSNYARINKVVIQPTP